MLTVRDVMKRDVLTVLPSTPMKDVAQVLVDRRVSGLPVVDEEGKVLGVVSEADFLIKEQGAEEIPHRPLSRFRGESADTRGLQAKVTASTAGEAMTAPAIVVTPSTSIREAAATMTTRRVNRLPVVDDGRLVGIVTRADLVRAYVRSDEELSRVIRDDVLLRTLWLDPAGFIVSVHDGVAIISGAVERRSTAESVERAIAMVPGVVTVQAAIAWKLEDRDIRPVQRDPAFPYSPH
jgi:CBS domain-containing protein